MRTIPRRPGLTGWWASLTSASRQQVIELLALTPLVVVAIAMVAISLA